MTKRLRSSSSAKISTLISKQETNISSATVRRRLNEQGLHKLQPLKKPLLSDTHRLNRLKWAKNNKKTDWTKIIFTDETTISLFGKPKKVWRQKGEIVKVPTVKHSIQVHIWDIFHRKALGIFTALQTILMLNYYVKFIRKHYYLLLKKFLGKMIIVGNYRRIMILSIGLKKAEKWREENQVRRISWAAQSPDLNSIENVWAVLKANISNYELNSIKELIKIIKREWKKLDSSFSKNLIISMKNRISLVLSNEGNHILY